MRYQIQSLSCALPLAIGVPLLCPGCRHAEEQPTTRAQEPETEDSYNAQRITPDGKLVAHDFTLTDQHGRRFQLKDQRGRPVLLFFGYTHCPDVCPMALSSWAKIEDLLGVRATEVSFAFITVDPERDTPQRLAKHMAIFSPRFLGLSGTPEELGKVFEAYGISAEKVPVAAGALGYLVDHSTQMFLIDQDGAIRNQYDYRTLPDTIANRLERLLRSPDPVTLVVQDAWSRPTAPGRAGETAAQAGHEMGDQEKLGPGVVYLSIVNQSDRSDRLLSVHSSVCSVAEMHKTTMDGNHMRMVSVQGGVEIPAGETTEFAPGGLHIMLIDLHHDLLAGERFELVLVFREAGEIIVNCEVRAP
ncbi:MAG: SCO family protein [Planctomycetes bacterium]|nr:SCO family protein [Planctomycetota bacterium]